MYIQNYQLTAMIIDKAQELGLCFGVRRALKLLQDATERYGRIESLGSVAHNRHLVEKLFSMGVTPIENIGQVRSNVLAISAHGTSPEILEQARAAHIRVIDTTCPLVRKAQISASELADEGFDVVIFGEAEHIEVKGLLGWAKGRGIATLDARRLTEFKGESRRLGIISQTTQAQASLEEFIRQAVDLSSSVQEIRIINTLCEITQKRQRDAVKCASQNELMIVIGGYDSANTRHLTEACSQIVETHQIEGSRDLNNNWFIGKHRIGITAGASTPDESIKEVVASLSSAECDFR